jgi:hypothetical protein
MRWWLGENDEKCGPARSLSASNVIATALLVGGEALLWIALPLALFVHVHK